MSKVDDLLKKYEDVFGDMFPTMCFQDEDWDSICDKIEQCLKQNKTAKELFNLDYSRKY